MPAAPSIAAPLLAACLAAACSGPQAGTAGRETGPAAPVSQAPPAAPRDAPASPATSAEAPAPPASADDPGPDAALAPGLAQLDELLLLRLDPQVRDELAPGFEAARQSLASACAARADDARCRAALATLDALAGWQSLVDGTTSAGGPGRAALQESLLSSLAAVAGTLPQTDAVRVTILFEAERPAEAADVLAAAWAPGAARGLGYAPLHAALREWRETLPEPQRLVPLLEDAGARGAATTPATLGYLLLVAGRRALAAGDTSGAAALFEQGAASFALATGDPLASEWELATRRADCLVNAGDIHYALARDLLASGETAGAAPELVRAEEAYSGALDAVPDDEGAIRGIELTADAYLGGEGGQPDQAGIRDVFGRAARRFDRPEWWNNYAFFCRETGMYEESYQAYSRCIELAPENARWVNDTGLILLYHLDRDLDRAQELFERSWKLGQEACDNPFVTDESRSENFLAYTDAMLNLAQLHGRRGELDRARAVLDELLALSPEREDARALDAQLDNALQKEAAK